MGARAADPRPRRSSGVGFKTVQEAIWLRNHVLSRLDVAAVTDDLSARRAALTFAFVGGGYAGVEALGELEDLARDAMRSYPNLRPEQMRWILVEAAGSILPEIGSDLADYAIERLRQRRIEVLLNTKLESAEGGVLRLSDGQVFAAETLVWTAGVKPSPLAAGSGFPVDDAGRIRTDAYLRVEGLEDAWAAGDAAAVPDLLEGGVMPPTAQHGMRQGKRLGDNVLAVLQGRRPEPFEYRAIGAVASLGRYKGVAIVRGVRLRGSRRGSRTARTTCTRCRRSAARSRSPPTGRSRCCSRATSRSSARWSTRASRSSARRGRVLRTDAIDLGGGRQRRVAPLEVGELVTRGELVHGPVGQVADRDDPRERAVLHDGR